MCKELPFVPYVPFIFQVIGNISMINRISVKSNKQKPITIFINFVRSLCLISGGTLLNKLKLKISRSKKPKG